MAVKRLDMEKYPRRAHFEYFKGLGYPYMGVTAEVDITSFLARVKAAGEPFFLSFLYCVSNAANDVPELRQRIDGDGVIEFDRCRTSHTVALEDGTYCYCSLDSAMERGAFLARSREKQDAAKARASVEDGDDVSELIFVSCTPWFTYTSIVQPVPFPADSNPRITWGKYFERDGRVLMPVTVQCHHAIVDGIHLARFFERLSARMGE